MATIKRFAVTVKPENGPEVVAHMTAFYFQRVSTILAGSDEHHVWSCLNAVHIKGKLAPEYTPHHPEWDDIESLAQDLVDTTLTIFPNKDVKPLGKSPLKPAIIKFIARPTNEYGSVTEIVATWDLYKCVGGGWEYLQKITVDRNELTPKEAYSNIHLHNILGNMLDEMGRATFVQHVKNGIAMYDEVEKDEYKYFSKMDLDHKAHAMASWRTDMGIKAGETISFKSK